MIGYSNSQLTALCLAIQSCQLKMAICQPLIVFLLSVFGIIYSIYGISPPFNYIVYIPARFRVYLPLNFIGVKGEGIMLSSELNKQEMLAKAKAVDRHSCRNPFKLVRDSAILKNRRRCYIG